MLTENDPTTFILYVGGCFYTSYPVFTYIQINACCFYEAGTGSRVLIYSRN